MSGVRIDVVVAVGRMNVTSLGEGETRLSKERLPQFICEISPTSHTVAAMERIEDLKASETAARSRGGQKKNHLVT
jgi:hypothetical protein